MNVKVFSANKKVVVEEKGFRVPTGKIDKIIEESMKEHFKVSKDGHCAYEYNAREYTREYNSFEKFIKENPHYVISNETDRKKLRLEFNFPYTTKEDIIQLSPIQKVAIDNIMKSDKIKEDFILFVNRHNFNAVKEMKLKDENTLIVEYYNTPIKTFPRKYNKADLETYLLKYGFMNFYKHAKDLVNIPYLYDLASNQLSQLLEYDLDKFYNIVMNPVYKVDEKYSNDFKVVATAFISVAEHIFKVEHNGKIYDLFIEYFNTPEVERVYRFEDDKYPDIVYYEGNLKFVFAFEDNFDIEKLKAIAERIYVDNFRKVYDIFSLLSYAQAVDYVNGEFVYVSLFDYYLKNRPENMLQ